MTDVHKGHSGLPPPDPSPTPPVVVTDPSTDPSNPSPATTDTATTDTTSSSDQFANELAQILAGTFGATQAPVDPEVRSADALYLKLWGVKPPPGYIEGLVHSGLNLYEIASNEMAKPAFAQTHSYRDSWAGYAAQVAQLFGRR